MILPRATVQVLIMYRYTMCCVPYYLVGLVGAAHLNGRVGSVFGWAWQTLLANVIHVPGRKSGASLYTRKRHSDRQVIGYWSAQERGFNMLRMAWSPTYTRP